MSRQITKASDIIEVLGGTKATCNLLGVTGQAVSHWRVSDLLPSHTYPIVQSELMKRGLSADLSVWRWDRRSKFGPDRKTNASPAG